MSLGQAQAGRIGEVGRAPAMAAAQPRQESGHRECFRRGYESSIALSVVVPGGRP
jgi:hypothetical protein